MTKLNDYTLPPQHLMYCAGVLCGYYRLSLQVTRRMFDLSNDDVRWQQFKQGYDNFGAAFIAQGYLHTDALMAEVIEADKVVCAVEIEGLEANNHINKDLILAICDYYVGHIQGTFGHLTYPTDI